MGWELWLSGLESMWNGLWLGSVAALPGLC